MRIPESIFDAHGQPSIYWERIDPERRIEQTIGPSNVVVLYEPARKGFTYGCSPEDVIHLLKATVAHVPALPDIIAFRQPTRNEAMLNPVWGRFLYATEIGVDAGTAIVLEAQEIGKRPYWPTKLSLDDQVEIARLRADGHDITRTRRAHVFRLDPSSIRSTLLYRTLFHELGHMVQYHEDVLSVSDKEHDEALHFHFVRPDHEREHYAHDMANRLATRLREDGLIPFDPL